MTQAPSTFTLDPATTVGPVTLGVADLESMVRFYQTIIGLTALEQTAGSAILGVEGRSLIRLESRPGGQRHPRATGLFHLALLLPTVQDLGHWLKHLTAHNYPLDGVGDHLVSEALYLSDPEGNGLEIYRDRPRDAWQYEADGSIKMATLAVDVAALLAAAPGRPFIGLPGGTTMGHVHLQVDDVDKAISFYRDGLGFDLMTAWGGAGFLSAGGYHHHLGVNIWNSRGAAPPPAGSLGLGRYDIVLPTAAARERLLAHLNDLNYPLETTAADPMVRDPAGNQVALTVV